MVEQLNKINIPPLKENFINMKYLQYDVHYQDVNMLETAILWKKVEFHPPSPPEGDLFFHFELRTVVDVAVVVDVGDLSFVTHRLQNLDVCRFILHSNELNLILNP